MAEKLSLKALADELEGLRNQLTKLETRFERRLESALEKASERLRSRIDSAEARRSGPITDVDARRRLVEQCAYLRAERRGFVGGDPQQDWLEAEMEVDHLLLGGWKRADLVAGKSAEISDIKSATENRA